MKTVVMMQGNDCGDDVDDDDYSPRLDPERMAAQKYALLQGQVLKRVTIATGFLREDRCRVSQSANRRKYTTASTTYTTPLLPQDLRHCSTLSVVF